MVNALLKSRTPGSFKLNTERLKGACCLPDGSLVCCAALTCPLIATCRVPRGTGLAGKTAHAARADAGGFMG